MASEILVLSVAREGVEPGPSQLEARSDAITVVTEPTADDALDRLDDESVDCIVSAHDLPASTGIELLEQVRERAPELPFVLFAADGSGALASDAIAAGTTDYVEHQQTADQTAILTNRIENAVEQFRAHRYAAEQERISSVIREINRALIRAESAAEVEQAVCEVMSGADQYLTACIAGVDPETMRIEPRTWGGADEGYFERLDMVVAEDAPGRHAPGGRAYHDREIAVSQDIPRDSRYEKWRPDATDRGFRALAVVPLEYDTTRYGLLAIFADRPHAFDDDERQLLSDLGDDVAHELHTQQLQSDLQQTTARLTALFAQSPDMIDIHDADGNITDHNPLFRERTGYDEATLANMKVWDLDQAIDAEEARSLWNRMDEGDTHRLEGEYRRADGSTFPVEAHIRRITLGGEDRFVVISHDITDRRRRQVELRRSERRFEAFLSDPQILMGLLDADGDVLDINDTAMEYVDVDRDAVVGTKIWKTPWWSEDHRHVVERKTGQAASGAYVTYEADLTYPDGEPYSVTVVIRPVRNDDGDVVSLVISGRDVTERKKREQQLEAMDRVLRHNLHNEMTVILGAAETIDERTTEGLGEFVEMIQRGCRELLGLTNKQRDIVELMTENPDIEPHDTGPLLAQCVADTAERHPTADITLDAPRDVRAEAVPSIGQAIRELVENAITHGENTAPSIEVTVESTPERVRISIADSGPRIPSEERAIIQGRGERGPLYHGSGMGLWLVNWIVSMSNGTVTYEEGTPAGNVVTVELPAVSNGD